MKNLYKLHLYYKNLLNQNTLTYFPDVKLGELLFSELWYMLSRCNISDDKRFDYLGEEIVFSNENEDLLLISYYRGRIERDEYWDCIKSYFGEIGEIIIKHVSPKKIDEYQLKQRTEYYNKIFYELSFIENYEYREYISNVLTKQYVYYSQVIHVLENKKAIFCYFSGGYYENIIMQIAKTMKIPTISFQHGQPVLRSLDEDYINQSQILNCQSDYYVCMNQHTVKQFQKIGVSQDRLPIIGNFNMRQKPFTIRNNKIFCLFLDSPQLPFSSITNEKMISFAIKYAQDYKYQLIIKPHPTLKIDKEDLKNRGVIVVESQDKFDCYWEKIDFAICHASSVYLDIYLNGVVPYVWAMDNCYYEITDLVEDYFFNEVELTDKIQNWQSLDYKTKVCIYDMKREQILNFSNVKEKFSNFVKMIQTYD